MLRLAVFRNHAPNVGALQTRGGSVYYDEARVVEDKRWMARQWPQRQCDTPAALLWSSGALQCVPQYPSLLQFAAMSNQCAEKVSKMRNELKFRPTHPAIKTFVELVMKVSNLIFQMCLFHRHSVVNQLLVVESNQMDRGAVPAGPFRETMCWGPSPPPRKRHVLPAVRESVVLGEGAHFLFAQFSLSYSLTRLSCPSTQRLEPAWSLLGHVSEPLHPSAMPLLEARL